MKYNGRFFFDQTDTLEKVTKEGAYELRNFTCNCIFLGSDGTLLNCCVYLDARNIVDRV